MARAALREALELRPGDAAIGARLEKLGGEVPVPVLPVWNGKDWTGWLDPIPSSWTVSDGTIVGDATDEITVVRGKGAFRGNFDVRVEARLLQNRSSTQPMHFAIRAA